MDRAALTREITWLVHGHPMVALGTLSYALADRSTDDLYGVVEFARELYEEFVPLEERMQRVGVPPHLVLLYESADRTGRAPRT
jgi:hypothetical protein